MDTVSQEYIPHDTYKAAWALLVLFTALLGGILWLTYHPRPLSISSPFTANSAGYDWFLVVHLPEVPKDPTRTAEAKERYASWLGTLIRAGYHPVLLTDVARRLQSGAGLPKKTIVLVFDPGYYHTYETLSPIFLQARVPAVWLTDRSALRRGDKHYVNRLMAHMMANSGFWDVGYFGEGFWNKNQTSTARQLSIGESLEAQWAAGAGRYAFNRSNAFASLQRLDVSPKWSDEQLLNRLALELPIQGPVHLGVELIQNRLRGVVIDSPYQDSRFNLRVPLSANNASVYWTRTQSIQDAAIDLKIPSYFGEVYLWLRSDTNAGQAVGVGFRNGLISIDQYTQNQRHSLKTIAWAGSARPIVAHITLAGDRLEVSALGIEPFHVRLPALPITSQSMVRLSIHDHLRGAAHADSIDIVLTPLNRPQASGPSQSRQ